jgi:hypothetical protein
VSETASAEINRQVQGLLDSSRKATALLKNKLQALEGAAGDLGRRLAEQGTALRAEFESKLEAERLDWRTRLEEVLQANEALAMRVAELERPRGLRALWVWLFGRKKAD